MLVRRRVTNVTDVGPKSQLAVMTKFSIGRQIGPLGMLVGVPLRPSDKFNMKRKGTAVIFMAIALPSMWNAVRFYRVAGCARA